MSITVITHPDCERHQPPKGHPERPQRLQAALDGIAQIDDCTTLEAVGVTREQLERSHGGNYLDQIESLACSGSIISLDADTFFGPESLGAIEAAAGAACQGVDRVMRDNSSSVFAVTRPPGHHAESSRAMGFCIYNNIAVAAAHAMSVYGLKRVAVCDFDVHHGNGTEQILAGNADALYVSSHQAPLYPGTGDPDDTVAENVVNATLTPHSGSDEFRSLWQEHLLPRIDAFSPDIVLVSAGFDGHWRDHLAQLQLKAEDFYWIGEQLKAIARSRASGRLVASLEGGYDLKALTESVLAFAEGIS